MTNCATVCHQPFVADPRDLILPRGGREPGEALLESVRARGVVRPIGVRPVAEAWQVVPGMGSRRARAAVLAGAPLVPCVEVAGSEAEALAAAVDEDASSAPLGSAWLCARLADLSSAGATRADLAEALGRPEREVGELCTLRRRLAPALRALFDRFDCSAVPLAGWIDLARLPADEQEAEYLRRVDGNGGRRSYAKRRPGPPTIAKMLRRLDEAAADDLGADFVRGLRLGLSVALGGERWPFTPPARTGAERMRDYRARRRGASIDRHVDCKDGG